MAEQWERLVPCLDGAGRARNLTVFIAEGGIGLKAPAGETAVIVMGQADTLKQAIVDAQVEIVNRGRAGRGEVR